MIDTPDAGTPTPDAGTPDACWVVTDGRAGMEVQCLGLAEALGLEPRIKRIQVTKPWRWLPPRLIPSPLGAIDPQGGPNRDPLAPPWPKLLIASGRQTVAPSMAIRRASGGGTFTVQIQNPVVDPAAFDIVVAPKHDRLTGDNVIETLGGLNRVTEARLTAAAAKFGPAFAHLPRPLVAVVLGGSNRVYRFTEAIARRLGEDLARLCRTEGAGLLVTASRRTDPGTLALLRAALAGCAAEIWDGAGDNPYLGYLALADAFVVTGDSVNMLCEAATTGKPVHVVELKGGSAKFACFHNILRQAGATRPFAGRLEHWSYPPLRDTETAAAEIQRRLAARAGA
ncbi:MAG: mitochondrial fission ELM1 family protein [Alphaproteobacteria bacterium]